MYSHQSIIYFLFNQFHRLLIRISISLNIDVYILKYVP